MNQALDYSPQDVSPRDRNFCRRNFLRRNFRRTEISPKRIFAQWNIRPTEFPSNGMFAVGILAERDFRRILRLDNLKSLFSDMYCVFYREKLFQTKNYLCINYTRPSVTHMGHYTR